MNSISHLCNFFIFILNLNLFRQEYSSVLVKLASGLLNQKSLSWSTWWRSIDESPASPGPLKDRFIFGEAGLQLFRSKMKATAHCTIYLGIYFLAISSNTEIDDDIGEGVIVHRGVMMQLIDNENHIGPVQTSDFPQQLSRRITVDNSSCLKESHIEKPLPGKYMYSLRRNT